MTNQLHSDVQSNTQLFIRQRREMAEVFGFETRNKFSIETASHQQIGFAAEQQKGIFGFFARQFLGHWRSFDLHIFDNSRMPVLLARHPFRFYFQRLEVTAASGEYLGTIEKEFALLSKKFKVLNSLGQEIFTVCSPIWKIWTFPFMRNGQEAATVVKKWGGVLKEAFLDADSFLLEFKDQKLSTDERLLLLAAGLFIDLQFFERKAR